MNESSGFKSSIVLYLKTMMVAVLLGLLFTFIPLDRTLRLLLEVSVLWTVVAVGLRLVNFLISSLKLFLLLPRSADSPAYSLWRVFGIYLSAKFFGNFLPTSVGGDVVKIRELSIQGSSISDASSAVVLERLTGILGVVFIAIGVCLPFDSLLKPYGLAPYRLLFLFLFFAGLVLIGAFWLYFPFVKKHLESWEEVPGFQSFLSFSESVLRYHGNWWQIVGVLLISVVYHLVRVLYLWVAIQAIGEGVPFLFLLPAVPIITFVSLIPISINNLGLREGAVTFALTALGLTSVQALSVALLTRMIGYALSVGGGLYYLGRGKKQAGKNAK